MHLAAAVAVGAARRRAAARVAAHVEPGFRLIPGRPLTSATWTAGDGDEIAIGYSLGAASGDTTLALEVNGEHHELGLRGLGTDEVRVRFAGLEHRCTVVEYTDGSVWVNSSGAQTSWRQEPRLPDPDAVAAGGGPVAPMSGTVVHVGVEPGDLVEAGQTLVVLEAMKMEHPALAAGPGVVDAVLVEVGQYVEAKTTLVTVTPREDS